MAVNQETLRQWYIALKSGEYGQGSSLLRTTDDEFCCWGVACELAGIVPLTPPPPAGNHYYLYLGQGSVPPYAVEKWLGVDSTQEVAVSEEVVKKYMNPRPDRTSLMNLNDMGVPFTVIADIIWDNYGEGEPPSLS